MASVKKYTKKDGTVTWYIRVMGPDQNGEWGQRFIACPPDVSTREEALNFGKDKEYEFRHGLSRMAKGQTFRKVAKEYIEVVSVRKNWSQRTRTSYESNFKNHVYPVIGKLPLEEIHGAHIDAVLSRVMTRYAGNHKTRGNRGNSTTTARLVYSYMNAVFNRAVKNRLITFNPMQQSEKPDKDDYEAKAMTKEDMVTFIHKMKGHWLYEAYMLDLAAGIRRGELIALRWRDINLEMLTVTTINTIDDKKNITMITTGKGAGKIISIPPDIGLMMRAYKELQVRLRDAAGFTLTPDTLIWSELDGSPMNPKRFSNEFKRILSRCQHPDLENDRRHFDNCTRLRDYKAHDLRHTSGTWYMELTGDANLVSKRLGHHSPAFTSETYLHSLPGQDKRAAEMFGEVLREALAALDESEETGKIPVSRDDEK